MRFRYLPYPLVAKVQNRLHTGAVLPELLLLQSINVAEYLRKILNSRPAGYISTDNNWDAFAYIHISKSYVPYSKMVYHMM